MQRIMENIQDLVRSICQPNPKKYPDPSIQQLILNRNIMNIWICTVFFFSYTIFSTFSKFSTTINLAIIVSSLFQLFSFIMLCRSYLWVFNILYVSVSFVLGSFALDMIQEATYFYIGHVFVLLFSILIRTGDTRLACFAGVVQIFTFLTKLKEKLIILVKEEEPEIFADKFVKITLFFFITMLLVNITLVKALDKRTLELSRAKHALENALDQQKTFIFSFSHELRNPINSLLGNLQLVLQGEVLSAKAAEMVGVAKVCGEILLHGINNVLDTGKHEIGKLEVNPVPTQLYELFQRTWGIYSELLRQKGLQSQLRIEKEMPAVVKIDSHKVNQILLNLIGNSIKFTKRGSISVTIKWLKCHEVCEKCFEPIPYDDVDEGVFEKEENLSTVNGSKYSEIKPRFLTLSNERRHFKHDKVFYPQEESKGVLKIIVKDTGSGMKKESLEKLFQKFSQVSENISQRQIGTGLGLFITKEICLAMNGEIRAYSKLGTGTTFIVCLPTVSVPLTTIQRADSEVIIQKLKERNLKALIADDSPFNVNLTMDYFSKFGGSVVSTAYNGYDAYMRYRECKRANVDIDLVILDIDMPTMDGRTVCDMIRKYEKDNRLKPVMIILISGNYDKEQINEYISYQKGHRADEFIRKPVSSSEFNRAVYNVIAR